MLTIQKVKETYRRLRYYPEEILWAQIWKDTKTDIKWLQDLPGISPGRWAVGYNYLYVMTRVLNEMEPHSVLDLGLGISSTLISTYFDYYKFQDAMHTVIERDESWIRFYMKKHSLSPVSEIVHCEYEDASMHGKTYLSYKDFQQKLAGKKYSVISIDAPEGSPRYSRRDIVPLLPNILEKSFVIIMDDANRKGEKDTIDEIKKSLCRNGIETFVGYYSGYTDCCIIASVDNKYFCTM